MNGKGGFVLMGLFVLTLTLAFIAVILWLSAGGGSREYGEYLVYMQESVSGLSRDNAVKYQGVDVGRVREIGLDGERVGEVRLLLQIDEGTPVREDTVATLEAQGLTGLAFINLSGGGDSPLLAAGEGEDYPVIRSRPSTWGRLDQTVEELVANLTDVSKLLKALLNEHNLQSFEQALAHLDTITEGMAGSSGNLSAAIDDLAATMGHARAAGERLPDAVDQLKDSALALEKMANDIGGVGVTFGQVIKARDRDLQQFTGQALPEAAVMINELRHTAENLRRFSERLERDPAVLLRGGPARAPGPGE